ncbi:MAG: heme o synthase [Alphaproteobacteria bacterium]
MANVRDIIALAKPRIIVLLAITCLAGSLVAAKGNWELLAWRADAVVWGLLGLVLSASGANMLNMWFDRDIDPLMKRTRTRPIPAGRMAPATVLVLGVTTLVLGGLAASMANMLTAAMALAGGLFYVLVYTMVLKRNTVQNIVIGGAAGAFPPVVGWAAVQGDASTLLPWLMFGVVFLWTPPHFWALALMANTDYTKAGVPMYPVVYGEAATRIAMMRYLWVLVAFTLLGGLLPPLGWLYTCAALGLGLWWGMACYRLLHAPQPTSENMQPARLVFIRSLYYLALLFAAMVGDSWY